MDYAPLRTEKMAKEWAEELTNNGDGLKYRAVPYVREEAGND